jgi:hypothetical protein
LVYIGICLIFYISNFYFYRNSIDAPVDLIFTIVYIFVASGTFVLYSLIKNDIFTKNNKVALVFTYLFVPFALSIVFAITYWIIAMQDSATLGQFMLVNIASFPLMFLAVIIVLLIQHYENSITKIFVVGVVIFIVYYFAIFGLGTFEKLVETSIFTNIGYVGLFIFIPFTYMIYLIRRLDNILG